MIVLLGVLFRDVRGVVLGHPACALKQLIVSPLHGPDQPHVSFRRGGCGGWVVVSYTLCDSNIDGSCAVHKWSA
jgi:hypothetical protein